MELLQTLPIVLPLRVHILGLMLLLHGHSACCDKFLVDKLQNKPSTISNLAYGFLNPISMIGVSGLQKIIFDSAPPCTPTTTTALVHSKTLVLKSCSCVQKIIWPDKPAPSCYGILQTKILTKIFYDFNIPNRTLQSRQ